MTDFDLSAACAYSPLNCDLDAGVVYAVGYKPNGKTPDRAAIVVGDTLTFNAAVEVSRIMSSTREIYPSIVVHCDHATKMDDRLAWCRRKFNIAGPIVILREDERQSDWMSQLEKAWSTGRVYGQEMALMKNPLISLSAKIARPLMAHRKPQTVQVQNGALVRSDEMDRDFELFVSLPDGYRLCEKSYPLLLVLDGNYGFAPAAQIARTLAATKNIPEAIVVGLGVPRREGDRAFGTRRLEEFSPPVDEYDFHDELGRILTPVFALAGKRIQQNFGAAPKLHSFVVDSLLPTLQAQLRIDETQMALFGHSAGGTYVAYEMLQERSPFTGYICSSPGLAISGDWLLHQIPVPKPQCQFVFGIGSHEFGNAFNIAAGIPKTPDYAAHWGEVNDATQLFTFEGKTHTSVICSILEAGMVVLWQN